MRRWGALALAVLSTAAGAQGSTALVGAGDCREGELQGHLGALNDRLRARLGDRLRDEEAVRERLRPQPTRSAEELRSQLGAAQLHFYGADFSRAEQAVTAVQHDVRRLPPGPDRFKLWADSELMLAVLYRDTGRAEAADEAFRRVLRVSLALELDQDFFSPSTRARFEKLRQEVGAAPGVKLEVRSSPQGADVFVEGLKIGATPFVGALPSGVYAVALVRGEARSLERQLVLAEPTQLQVDLDFEGAIRGTRVVCASDGGDEATRLSHAVKLGAMLKVEELVVAWLDRPASGSGWFAAALVNVGTAQKVREGGLKLRGASIEREPLEELANFLVTGERTRAIVTPRPDVAFEGAAVTRPTRELAAEREGTAGPRDWRRPAAWVAGGIAVGAAATGVYFLTRAGAARAEYEGYLAPSGGVVPERRLEAAAALEREGSNRTLSWTFWGLGAAALGTGVFLFATSGADAAVALVPSSDGAAVAISARF